MKKQDLILAGFVILKFLLQYHLISPEYDLQRDEYLYLDQGNHLALGYVSVPPFTSWVSFIIKLLGNGIFWVRFFPALFGALTIIVVWKIIESLKGNLFALILGATCVLFSALLRLNALYQPNSLDVLCWTALYFTIIKYLDSEKPKWLFISAVVMALGFLNKYNIVFLVIGFVPALFITKQRTLLFSRNIIAAALLAGIIVFPNLLWQYTNYFPVIHHMKELSELQLVNVNRFDFLKSQLMFFLGSLPVIAAGLYALLFYPPFKKYSSFFWSLIITLIVFVALRAKDYYAIGLYPIYIAFGAVYLGELLSVGWKKKYLRPAPIIIPLIVFIPMYRFAFPNKSPEEIVQHHERYQALGLLRWEDGKDHQIPQDYADMLGWKELAKKVDKAYEDIGDPENTLVLCDNYGQAGAINYFTTKGIKAVSFNADYIEWFDLDHQYVNLIRVKGHEERHAELKETSPHFNTGVIADSITNKYARENGTTIFAFVGSKVDVNQRIKDEINEIKGKL
jgi:4-amino-4-deoxy-L-arabinose transferase-like glycosyltransferase